MSFVWGDVGGGAAGGIGLHTVVVGRGGYPHARRRLDARDRASVQKVS